MDHRTEVDNFDALFEHWNIQRSKWHNYQCSIKEKANLTDETYTSNMYRKGETPKEWTKKKHKDWCDQFNSGFTHYGIDPRIFPCGRIRFDVFHMVKNLLVLILDQLGKYMTNQSVVSQKKLNATFRNHWGDYPADVFLKRQGFASMTGVRLAEFLEIAHLVVADIEKFKGRDIHRETKSFIGILELFPKIVAFTKQTIIEDCKEEEYKEKMKQFKKDIKTFYD